MDPTRLIKKYPNRRLYDTQASIYITLSDVKGFVLNHTPFRVIDARSQEDLTRCILMQIILDEELGQSPLFSCEMLSQMIRAYGNNSQGFLGNHLERGLREAIESQQAGISTPSASLPGLMGHYLAQMTQLYLAMQQQAETPSLHDQPMGTVNGKHSTGDQRHLPQRRTKIHPPV